MTKKQFLKFMYDRPSLNMEGLSVEGGKTRKNLALIVDRMPEDKVFDSRVLLWLMPLVEKYGYNVDIKKVS